MAQAGGTGKLSPAQRYLLMRGQSPDVYALHLRKRRSGWFPDSRGHTTGTQASDPSHAGKGAWPWYAAKDADERALGFPGIWLWRCWLISASWALRQPAFTFERSGANCATLMYIWILPLGGCDLVWLLLCRFQLSYT